MKITISATTLTIILAILKLTGVFTFSWLWVLCPLWIPIALFGVYLLLMILFVIIAILFS
jgi:hypothetical protein